MSNTLKKTFTTLTHTNPDGRKVKVKLMHNGEHVPKVAIAPNVALGRGIVMHGNVFIKEGAIVGDNVEMRPYTHIGCFTKIGAKCRLGTMNANVRIGDNCIVGKNSAVIGNLVADSVIGASCEVSGNFHGSVGDFSTLKDEFNQQGAIRVKIGQHSSLVLHHPLGHNLLNLECGDHTVAELDHASGNVIVGSYVRIQNPLNYSILHNVRIPDHAVLPLAAVFHSNTLITVEGGMTFVIHNEIFYAFDKEGHDCADQFGLVEALLLPLHQKHVALTTAYEESQNRLKALRDKVGTEVSRLSYLFHHEVASAPKR